MPSEKFLEMTEAAEALFKVGMKNEELAKRVLDDETSTCREILVPATSMVMQAVEEVTPEPYARILSIIIMDAMFNAYLLGQLAGQASGLTFSVAEENDV